MNASAAPYLMINVDCLHLHSDNLLIKQVTFYTVPDLIFAWPVRILVEQKKNLTYDDFDHARNAKIVEETGLVWNKPGIKLKTITRLIISILRQHRIRVIAAASKVQLQIIRKWLKYKVPFELQFRDVGGCADYGPNSGKLV